MASPFDPAVLLSVAWLVALFATVWRYQWSDLPPARATLVFAGGALWLAYSLTQLADLVAPPYDGVLVVAAALLLIAGVGLFWRWLRQR